MTCQYYTIREESAAKASGRCAGVFSRWYQTLGGHFVKWRLTVGVHYQSYRGLRIDLINVPLALRDYFAIRCPQTPVPKIPRFIKLELHGISSKSEHREKKKPRVTGASLCAGK